MPTIAVLRALPLPNQGDHMATIEDIEGIGPAYAAKLREAGVNTVEGLLEHGASSSGRDKLEAATGISGSLILTWVNHADLFRINGVAGQFSELLEAAGVDSVPELAQRNPANLAAKLAEVNAEKNLTNRVPGETEVADWIEQAKSLGRKVTH
jgi:predicted flap endonuclease-1-like 5' DNA nuclease